MAASLSSVEAEELVPAAVFEDEADCMGLISGYPVCWFKLVMFLNDRMSRAKFWRMAGIADYLVRELIKLQQLPPAKSQEIHPDPSQGDPFFCSQRSVAR